MIGTLHGSGIGKTPVQAAGGGGKDRTELAGVVANGDDVIEGLAGAIAAIASGRTRLGWVPALNTSKRSPARWRHKPSAI